jgi:hypothetical protein
MAADAGEVGRTLLAAGDVVAIRGSQTIRLAVGSTIQTGDTLRTGQASNLQVRFIDDSIISLKEASELRIDNFRFNGTADGSERAFFTLVKGGLRTMTGAIGGKNNKNYSMRTPVATLGVRGTDYAMTLCQQDCRNADGAPAKDGLYGRVMGMSHGSNSIVITNSRDSRIFGINENFFVADTVGRVERLTAPPAFVANRLDGRKQADLREARVDAAAPAGHETASTGGVAAESRPNVKPEPAKQMTYIPTENVGKQRPATESPRIVIFPLTSGSDKAIVDSDSTSFDASNNLTSFNLTAACSTCSLTSTVDNITSIVESASATLIDGGVIYWGRWNDGSVTTSESKVLNTKTTTTSAGVPFVVGDTATSIPRSGSFVYSLAGGPSAVDTTGAVGGKLTQGAFQVNFGAAQAISVATPLQLSVGGVNYTLSSACGGTCVFSGPSAWMNMTLSGVCSGGACLAAAPAQGDVTALLVGPYAGGLTVGGSISSPAPTVTFTGAFAR